MHEAICMLHANGAQSCLEPSALSQLIHLNAPRCLETCEDLNENCIWPDPINPLVRITRETSSEATSSDVLFFAEQQKWTLLESQYVCGSQRR